jgi:chromosome segregation ATPase
MEKKVDKLNKVKNTDSHAAEFNIEIKQCTIEDYNHKIYKMKEEMETYVNKIEYIKQKIHEIEREKYKYCKSTGGHVWKIEREPGYYGALFRYCDVCKIGN